jgi:membrane-associated phospholipid phosphatase
LLILLIGFSRIYLRVHYTSDVLAGFIIGVLWLVISLEALHRLEDYFNKERSYRGIRTVTPEVDNYLYTDQRMEKRSGTIFLYG